jgi:hypothetical protein
MSSISLTPTKSTKVCCVCGENKKGVCSIESEKGKERNVSQLLLKYGDLNLVQGQGIICRNCHDNLLNLHKHATKFWEQCQSSKSKSKRCMNDPLQDISDTLNSSNNSTLLKDSGIFSPLDCSTPIPNRPTTKSRKTLNHIFDESISLPPFLPIGHDTPVRLLWTSNSIQEFPRLLENKGNFFNSFRILRTSTCILSKKMKLIIRLFWGIK